MGRQISLPPTTTDAGMSPSPDAPLWVTRELGDAAGDVTCATLRLGLSTIRLYIEWHAGVMSSEAAMERLGRDIGETISSSTQPLATEPSRRGD